MPRRQPPPGYYTATEAIERLGISEGMLYNHVRNGNLHRVVPKGRKQGFYLKSEVDALASNLQRFFASGETETHAEKRGGSVFQVARPEDMDGVYELASRLFSRTTSADQRRVLLAQNPDGNYVVKHEGKVVAYLILRPLKHERLMAFMSGQIRAWDLTPEDIDVFEPGKAVECLFSNISSEPDVNKEKRVSYVVRLLYGTAHELERLGHKGIIITKIYAVSDTPTGIAMAVRAKMKPFGPPLGKRLTFELDVETSESLLLKGYKRGLAAWREEQKNGRKQGRNIY
jgi:hypothetical protein